MGFSAASQTEFEFLRNLIDEDLIPKDVTVHLGELGVVEKPRFRKKVKDMEVHIR